MDKVIIAKDNGRVAMLSLATFWQNVMHSRHSSLVYKYPNTENRKKKKKRQSKKSVLELTKK